MVMLLAVVKAAIAPAAGEPLLVTVPLLTAEITPPEAVIVVPSTWTQPFTELVLLTQEMVPVVVIGPPVKPVPVATLVTVPVPAFCQVAAEADVAVGTCPTEGVPEIAMP